LPEPTLIKMGQKLYRYRREVGLAALAVLVLLLAWQPWEPGTLASKAPRKSLAPTSSQDRVSACSTMPQPSQGIYKNYDGSPHVARFTIRTSVGSSYFVKLEDAASRRPVMTFFVNGGGSITEYVPLGNFILKYATGQSWCGDSDLFGDDTTTNTADDDFLFERHDTGDGYSTSVWTVELIRQPGGNLRTHRISKNEF
jgi:hypothetical protein